MKKDQNPKSELPRGAVRALALLAGAEVYAVESEGGDFAIVGRPRGVSVRIGGMSRVVLNALLAAGLAVWEAEGTGRRRLVASETGRARAARETAPADVDPFLLQHRPLRRGQAALGENPAALIDDGESPLAWLARRRGRDGRPLVDAACLEAGERLRRDLTLGALLPRVTANWSASVASGPRNAGPAAYSDTILAARQRARKALAAVGPDFAGLLLDICGFLKGLEAIEREHGWPVRSGKLVLELALRQLCRHYGLDRQARGGRGPGLRHWGSADYRPFLPEVLAQE